MKHFLVQVKFPFSPAGSGMLVLDTDYDNFAAVYSCIDFPVVGKFEYAWILTRNPFPTEETVLNNKTSKTFLETE